MSKHIICTLLSIFVIVLSGATRDSFAQEVSLSATSLKGVKAIDIVVEELQGPESLSREELARMMMDKLKPTGLKIDRNLDGGFDDGYLYLNYMAMDTSECSGVIFYVSLEFKQYLKRDGANPWSGSVTTWNTGMLAKTPKANGRSHSRDVVERLLSDFVISYLAANR